MNNDDTLGWLGMPTPLEMYRQHCRLLENEVQELNAQLRKARADVFGISQMRLDTQAKNAEFARYLRQRGGEADELRRIVNEMRPRPTTI